MMKNKCRSALVQISALKGYYCLLALLSMLCSIIGMFVTELLYGAVLLKKISYIPYDAYYLVSCHDAYDTVKGDDTHLAKDGLAAQSYLSCFENVQDVLMTECCYADAQLKYFQKDLSVSASDSGTFPWTVVPDSAYDDAFQNAECYLVSGRHLTQEDQYVALLDTELAKINALTVGDRFTSACGDVYTVVGLFQTIKIDPVITAAPDVPHNMIYVSDRPSDAAVIDTYNLYISFSYPYSTGEVKTFSKYFSSLLGGQDILTYELTSVKLLNQRASYGVSSMLRLSVCCGVMMVFIIIISLYVFVSTLEKKRQREFLLYHAIGKTKRQIMIDYGMELLLVMIPSVLLGILFCHQVLLRYIKSIISYFEKMVSIETIFSTSTLSLQKTAGVSTGIFRQISSQFWNHSGLFFLMFLLITLGCIFLMHAVFTKASVMNTLSEK